MPVLFLIFLDQICQKWIKLDQTFWPETCVKFEVAFWLEKAFSNESALLLKVLKVLAHL